MGLVLTLPSPFSLWREKELASAFLASLVLTCDLERILAQIKPFSFSLTDKI